MPLTEAFMKRTTLATWLAQGNPAPELNRGTEGGGLLIVDERDDTFCQVVEDYIVEDGPADVAYATYRSTPQPQVVVGQALLEFVGGVGRHVVYSGPRQTVLELARAAGDPLQGEDARFLATHAYQALPFPLDEVLRDGEGPLWSCKGAQDALVEIFRHALLQGRQLDRPPHGMDKPVRTTVRKSRLLWRVWAWPGQGVGERELASIKWHHHVQGLSGSVSWRHMEYAIAYIELVEIEGMALVRLRPQRIHEMIRDDLEGFMERAREQGIQPGLDWAGEARVQDSDEDEPDSDWEDSSDEGPTLDEIALSYLPAWLAMIRAIRTVDQSGVVKRTRGNIRRRLDGVTYRGGS